MSHLAYLLILAACVLGTLPLEFLRDVRVYAQWRRLAVTVLAVVIVFGGEDLYAISRGWWHFNRHYLLGPTLPGRLPMEELLFFVVIPICAVFSYEAVLARRPDWRS